MLNIQQIAILPVAAILSLAACKREPIQPPKPTIYGDGLCGGRPSWSVAGSEGGELMTYNRLQVTPAETLWNGVAVSRATLNDYLGQIRALNPRPVTALVPDSAARCNDVEAVRRVMEVRLQCATEGHCVEYPETEWAKRHPPIP
jgi:hypothetical protein